MNEYMILNAEHEVVSVDLLTWAKTIGKSFDFEKTRRVGSTIVDEARVSTVFLGIDYSYGIWRHGGFELRFPPLWFETMIFGGPFDEAMFRYTTWAEAEAGHARVVAALERGEDPE